MTAPWEDPRVTDGFPRQLEKRRHMLEDGARTLGWKVGFGAPASLELMQINAPLLGFLTDSTLVPSERTVDTSAWQRGLIEFEVAVVMGADLGPGASDEAARAAVAAVGPAIELADVDLPVGPDGVADILAGDIFHRAVILGEMDEQRAGIDIDGLEARIRVDGEAVAETADLEAITGPYPWIVSTVATTLDAFGAQLSAGDVIITGSVVPPMPLEGPRSYEFVLDPFPPISVSVR